MIVFDVNDPAMFGLVRVGGGMEQHQVAALLQQKGIDTQTLVPLTASAPVGNYRLSIVGAEALALWHRLRALVEETGFWPILLGGEEDIEEYTYDSWNSWDGGGQTPERVIEAGVQLDARIWVQERLTELGHGAPRGPWPEDVPPFDTFTIPYDLHTWKPLPTVYIALVPTRHGWQAPAFLLYGGWNACPNPEQHVCMLKYWAETYGAEPVGMALSRVELRVNRPPTNRERALDLAQEQYAYCEDIVDQGTETLDVLAAGLLNGTSWYFWWD